MLLKDVQTAAPLMKREPHKEYEVKISCDGETGSLINVIVSDLGCCRFSARRPGCPRLGNLFETNLSCYLKFAHVKYFAGKLGAEFDVP